MRWMNAAVLVAVAWPAWGAAPPGKTRELTVVETKVVAALQAKRNRHATAGEFEQAAKVAQQIADYRSQRQGARHWQAIDARFETDEWRRLVAVPAKDRLEERKAHRLEVEGTTLLDRSRFRESDKLLRQALAIREKLFGPNHPITAHSYNSVAYSLRVQGKPAEALPLHRKVLAIRKKALGTEHPDTAFGYSILAVCLRVLGKEEEALALQREALAIREKVLGQSHPDTAISCNNVAACLDSQGKSAEALNLYQKAVRVAENALGPQHLDTASYYNNLAVCLAAQGKYAEALPLFRRALLVREKRLGEQDPDTATSYNNVAFCLNNQGKASEALPLYHKALLIREKVLGSEHPDTATSYNNVAACLLELGKLAEALPRYRKALRIIEQAFGVNHHATATGYNNLASCLQQQGKPAEALPLLQRALQIRAAVLGAEHHTTADSYDNVAYCLAALDKPEAALPLHRKALLIRRKVLGSEHPSTGASLNNLAFCLDELGKSAEALPLYREAIRIGEKVNGSSHPSTASSYNNLAASLSRQGKHSEALPLLQKALRTRADALGLDHPDTATSYNNVALCLWEQKQYRPALRLWQQSLSSQESARALRTNTGFERAEHTRGISTQAALAVGLARLNQPRNAFAHAEASLARGLLDDLGRSSRLGADRIREIRSRLVRLEPALASFSARNDLSAEQQSRHEQLKKEYVQVWREWSDLLGATSSGQVLPVERIQESIPDDSALVLFIDALAERWACILRRSGKPAWVRIGVTEKASLPRQLYDALHDPTSDEDARRNYLKAFRQERFDPLRPHLKGVKRLFVVPTGHLAYIPADLLAEDFSVCHVPSGSVFARLRESHRPLEASSLLAVGDPIFDRTVPPDPPSTGVLVRSVLPDSHAMKAGLRGGDVLISVGSTQLDAFDDLAGALSVLPANAEVWREGKRSTVRLPGTPLGAAFDRRSVSAALRAWRSGESALAQRTTGHSRLPGTRLEVDSIAALFQRSTRLLGSDASEQRLDELLDGGKLKGYRIVHVATHGETDNRRAGQSALILAQDRLPDPLAQVSAKKHPYDGRLTVSRIRERWQLDADLVVLSACETGLGKDAKGEGLLGFAQAFLSRGARSVVLSRWKVDDTATSLLMIRFYENLLGKRKGAKAMGRAASLDEAKKWLRTLSRKEAERLATLHTGGVLRGSEGTEKTPDKAKKVEYKGDSPFAHPYYWAAWTLIGDPD